MSWFRPGVLAGAAALALATAGASIAAEPAVPALPSVKPIPVKVIVIAIAAKQGLVDPARVLVLRTSNNPSMPPPGVSAVESVANEGAGQAAAYEADYRVGAPVVHELLAHWDRDRDQIPGTPSS